MSPTFDRLARWARFVTRLGQANARRLLIITASLSAGCAPAFVQLAEHSAEGWMPRVCCVLMNLAIINRLATGGVLAAIGFIIIFGLLLSQVVAHWKVWGRLYRFLAIAVVGFFVFCGTGHALGVLVLSWPGWYDLLSWVELGTGCLAVMAVPALWLVVRDIKSAVAERDRESQLRQTAEEQLGELKDHVRRLSEQTAAQVDAAEANFAERMASLRRLAMESERDWLQGDRAQAFVNAIPSPVCAVDQDGEVFALVNKAFARALGREPAEMNGQRWKLFMHRDDIERIDRERQQHQEALNRGEQGTGEFTTRYVHRDGQIVVFHWRPGPMAGVEPAYYIAEEQAL